MKYNKSKTYLLPLLSEVVFFDRKFLPYLENTYMFDDTGKYENCFFILHEFNFKDKDFTAYEHKMIDNELFVELVDIGEKVLYIFKFPEIYLKEYNYLKESKYSKFDNYSKEVILNFWTHVYENNFKAYPFLKKVKQILYKDKYLKLEMEQKLSSPDHIVKLDDNAELGEFVDIENETFKLSKIKQNEENKNFQ